MQIEMLNDLVSVSDQLSPDDLPQLKAQGVEILVCNRPDGEVAGQPTFDEIATRARASGMQAVNIAFSGNAMSPAQVAEYARLLAQNKRLHAYCRSGNRSTLITTAGQQLLQQG